MPKKDKKCKNNHRGQNVSKELILAEAENEQTYGNITKALGSRRFDVQCQDGVLRKCQVRGNMRNRKFVNVGDVVIVSLRDFQQEKGDILHVYNSEEVRCLKNMEELKMEVRTTENEDKEDVFDFQCI